MNIEEGNELIAKFLGCSRKIVKYQQQVWNSSNEYYWDWTEGELWVDEHGEALNDECDELIYHASWDELMLIIQKIKTLDESEFNYQVTNMTLFRIQKESLLNIPISSEIEVVYSQIVDFIKWYNNAK